MVRISKQEERRARSPRKPRRPGVKTGPKKDLLPSGYKIHMNGVADVTMARRVFIAKSMG